MKFCIDKLMEAIAKNMLSMADEQVREIPNSVEEISSDYSDYDWAVRSLEKLDDEESRRYGFERLRDEICRRYHPNTFGEEVFYLADEFSRPYNRFLTYDSPPYISALPPDASASRLKKHFLAFIFILYTDVQRRLVLMPERKENNDEKNNRDMIKTLEEARKKGVEEHGLIRSEEEHYAREEQRKKRKQEEQLSKMEREKEEMAKRIEKLEQTVEILKEDNEAHNEFLHKITGAATKAENKIKGNHKIEEAEPLLNNNDFMLLMQEVVELQLCREKGWQFKWDNKYEATFFASIASHKYNLTDKKDHSGDIVVSWKPFEALFNEEDLRLANNDIQQCRVKVKHEKEIKQLFK